MRTELFNRLNDAYFKAALASPLRKHITIAFLNAVLSHVGSNSAEVGNVEFLDREPVSDWEGEKVPRFDVFLRAKFIDCSLEAKLFHIEVQDAEDKFFLKRGFYYAGNDYVSQSRRGLKYEEFEPVIFVSLANFVLRGKGKSPANTPEWYNLHKVLNTVTHECDFDFMEIHTAELPLLRSKWRRYKHKPSTEFEELLFYFGNVGGKKMADSLVQEIAERNSTVAELLEFEKAFRTDPLMMRQYIMAERAHFDYLANLECEREEGREQGREEGRNEIIRTIRANGTMTDEQIASLLKLPVYVVEKACSEASK